MTSRDFAFWLQGFFEVANPNTIGSKETEMIKKHLNLVFKHEIDPAMGDEKHQQVLNEIHSGNGTSGPSTIFPLNNNPNDGVLRC
jgi:hypothetical protein